MSVIRTLLVGMLVVLGAWSAKAELRVANVFSDHMVLQQEMPIRVWGWAEPGQTVIVALEGGRTVPVLSVKAGNDGRWMANLDGQKADGKPRTLKGQAGDKTAAFEDVLLGEVWICSGQSNMEWPVRRCANAQQEINNAKHPTIRLYNVPEHIMLDRPHDDAQPANWFPCTPQTVAGFSATGYYFGRALSEQLDVPIGLVGANWGGTRIEPWTPPAGFHQVPELEVYSKIIKAMDPATPEGNAVRKDYIERVEAWLGNAKAHVETGKETGSAPQLNLNPPHNATKIYNGMVAGLTPLSARGVIWYQGESNAGDGLGYDALKEALVKGWREVFQNDKLSFYWVQLADFGRGHTVKPEGGGWGPVREGQRRALRLPHTGMAVIIDIGDARDIHPKNKQDVGKRLAHWALAKDYNKDVVPSGPLYKSHTIEGNKAVIKFHYTDGGLTAGTKGGEHRMDPVEFSDDKRLKAFSVRDQAGKWHWAQAVIKGDTVVVSAEGVDKPTAVRYAYDSDPDVNFYNKAGLPASPFTTVD